MEDAWRTQPGRGTANTGGVHVREGLAGVVPGLEKACAAKLAEVLGEGWQTRLGQELGPVGVSLSRKEVGPIESWAALGYLGQYLVVVPESGIVGVQRTVRVRGPSTTDVHPARIRSDNASSFVDATSSEHARAGLDSRQGTRSSSTHHTSDPPGGGADLRATLRFGSDPELAASSRRGPELQIVPRTGAGEHR